ncbi:MAG: PHP domain-containing protein [Rhodothermales bacterium]
MTDLFAGRVLFHCHTSHTDGRPTVDDYVCYAAEHGIERVVFLEHIRRVPSYDVPAFADEVRASGERHGVPTNVGFEAKVLPGGELDIADEHLALADVTGIAEHGFPDDAALWEASLRQAFETYGGDAARPAVWVHPGLWLRKTRRLDALRGTYEALLGAAQDAGVFVEQNARYGLLTDDDRALVRPASLVRGADAHRLADVAAFFDATG